MQDEKKVLVTGGAGYIGSHTIINLLNHNKKIVIFDNLENGHIETIEALKKIGSVEFIKGDLRNPKDIEQVFEEHDIEAVVHFAAFALVEESVKNPSKYYRNNVYGTLNLLDSMIKYGCRKIVFSSTCAVYGNPDYVPVDETHSLKPVSPYGASKHMAEQILKDYDTAYGLKSVKLRYFNVAGCDSETRVGEWHEPETHLVPNILKSAFSEGKTFKIFGYDYNTPDGTCIRDYVNVEDLAEAHRLALIYLEKENKSDVFNVGTECGNSVKNIFDVCEKVTGKKIKAEVADRRAGDAGALYANSKKAQTILGWKPERTIEDSISSAYSWEKELQQMLNITNLV